MCKWVILFSMIVKADRAIDCESSLTLRMVHDVDY